MGARAHEVGVAADEGEGAVLDLDAVEAAAAALGRRRLLPVRQEVPEGRALERAPRLRILQDTACFRPDCDRRMSSTSQHHDP